MTISGRVYLVTGATSGIGGLTAHALADLGASVAVLGRRASELDVVAGEIRANTGNHDVTAFVADLAWLASIGQAADHSVATHDRLHVLVSTACYDRALAERLRTVSAQLAGGEEPVRRA